MDSSSRLETVCLLAFLLAGLANAITSHAVFNVKDFGAIADGQTESTQALLSAWKEACASNGMNRILIPEGEFMVGPVVLKGPCKGTMVFQLKGIVKAPTDLNKFDSDSWIHFQYIDGLKVTGHGTLDGQGASAWPHNECPKSVQCKLLPTSLRLSFVTNAIIMHISSIDSKFFHVNIFESKNIKLHNLKISAPGDSPNTDGIHIGSSSGIKIFRSEIATGDDCISIGPGSSDITISNIFCGPGHGISVGSLGKYPNEEDVVGLTVQNCTLTGTTNGLRVKSFAASPPSSASNFTFKDIIMNNVYNPIIIDQEYCPYASCNKENPSQVKLNDITFENIKGSSASQVAVNILCSKAVPCQGVELHDIGLEYNGEGGVATSSCLNVNGLSSGQQNPPSCL